MSTLSIVTISGWDDRPEVRLLVDGEDVLDPRRQERGNHPADILDTGALLPVVPARRIAFYGCGCGEFGCGNVAGLITRRADRVTWSDFRSLTGAYHSAIATPDPEVVADPLVLMDPDFFPSRVLGLPTVDFDAEDYLAVVHAAMAERGRRRGTRARRRR